MERRQPVPIKDLNLDVLNPQKGHEQLKHFAEKTGLIPVDDDHISVKALIQLSETKRVDFMSETGRKIQTRANKAVYEAIEDKYDLLPGAGKGFWSRQWGVARNQVHTLVDKFAEDNTSVFGFLNEMDTPPSPAEVIHYLTKPDEDPRLRFETTRQGTLSLIAADLEKRADGAQERLTEVDQRLNAEIFNSKEKPPKIKEVWALHDNRTNALVEIEGKPRMDRPDEEDGKNEEYHEFREGAHWKLHRQRMRFAGEGIGWVITNRRIKEGGVNKTVKKAILREEQGADTYFDPKEDVPDMAGMQLVVRDDDYHDGERVQRLVEKVKDVLSEIAEEKGIEVTFKEKNGNTGNRTQSGKFQAYRLMAQFSDLEVPLELMFHGQADQLKNNFEIGEYDTESDKPNGAAHKLTDADRSLLVLQRYIPDFPPDAPDGDRFYGKPDWENIRKKTFKETETRLRNANMPPEQKQALPIIDKAVVFESTKPLKDAGLLPLTVK